MEPFRQRFIRAIITTFLLSFFSGLAFSSPKTLLFSAIPDQDQDRLIQRFDKVADYLSEKLGIPVKYVPVKSYTSAIIAFRNNQVQLAWFGGLSGVRARQLVRDSEALAQGIEDTHFQTYFIAHHGTGLKESDDFPVGIAGKSLTFGSKNSTSGRLMPEFFIRKHFNQSPDTLFSRVSFSGNHSKTIEQVQDGDYQIGVINYQVWQKEKEAGLIDSNKVSVIWKTPSYPDYQWTIRGDVENTWGEGFKDRVKQALLEMKDPALLKAFPRNGFISATNSDYQPILETAKKIGLIE